MRRIISFIFLLALINISYADINPDIRDEVDDCRLLVNQDSIIPGATIRMGIFTILKDGSELSSEYGWFNPNLSDYLITIEGPVEILKKNKKFIYLKIRDDAYSEPFITVKMQLKKRKSIHRTQELRIRSDLPILVEYFGKDGYDPATSTDESKLQILNSRFYLSLGYRNTLSSHSGEQIDGYKGPNLKVYVSLIQVGVSFNKLLKIQILDSLGNQQIRYIEPEKGDITISTIGGTGGTSTHGGRGGDGGDVTIYITAAAKPFLDQIYIRNFGGEGGPLWRPENPSQRGPVGFPGKLNVVDWNGEPINPPEK